MDPHDEPPDTQYRRGLLRRDRAETPRGPAAYLDEVCGSDPELRRRVERLLDAQPKWAVSWTRPPRVDRRRVPAASRSRRTNRQRSGTDDERLLPRHVIAGRYKLLQQIGEGGMGTVYMAEQTQPVKRRLP